MDLSLFFSRERLHYSRRMLVLSRPQSSTFPNNAHHLHNVLRRARTCMASPQNSILLLLVLLMSNYQATPQPLLFHPSLVIKTLLGHGLLAAGHLLDADRIPFLNRFCGDGSS